ncbi:MAG: alpha/beta fold hydrolase [Azospirillaceae bacterium]
MATTASGRGDRHGIGHERIGPAPFIAVDHSGAGAGELVLFMHGIGGNRTNWTAQVPVFGARYHAVAWDARGYGASDDYVGPLAFGDFGDDVLRVLDHFGAERAHLIGLSMGGRIAMDVAGRYPGRVRSLILVDTHMGFGDFSEADRQAFLDLRRKPLLEGHEPRDIAAPVARSLLGPKASEAHFRQLHDSLCALHKESYIKSIEATVLQDRFDHLEGIAAPTLVLAGADDRLTPPDMARRIAARIPGAECAIIPDAGHLSNIEQPKIFNRRCLDFLSRLG